MPYNAAHMKSVVRGIVHKTFALEAEYAPVLGGGTKTIHVRWHNKITPRGDHGDLLDIGYADVIEGVDQLIFSHDELIIESITLRRGDRVTVKEPRFNDPVLILDTQNPQAGPQEVIWRVAHEGAGL